MDSNTNSTTVNTNKTKDNFTAIFRVLVAILIGLIAFAGGMLVKGELRKPESKQQAELLNSKDQEIENLKGQLEDEGNEETEEVTEPITITPTQTTTTDQTQTLNFTLEVSKWYVPTPNTTAPADRNYEIITPLGYNISDNSSSHTLSKIISNESTSLEVSVSYESFPGSFEGSTYELIKDSNFQNVYRLTLSDERGEYFKYVSDLKLAPCEDIMAGSVHNPPCGEDFVTKGTTTKSTTEVTCRGDRTECDKLFKELDVV